MWRGFDFSREGGNNACIITRHFPRLSNHRQLYYAITTPYYYSFARFSRRKRPWKNPFGREEWKKMGKVWSLTDEDGESCPCVWSKDEERFEYETGRERDRFLSRVFIGLRSLSRKNGITAIEALRKLTSFTERKRS